MMEIIFKVAAIFLFVVCAAMVIAIVLIDLKEKRERERFEKEYKRWEEQSSEPKTPGLRYSLEEEKEPLEKLFPEGNGQSNLEMAKQLIEKSQKDFQLESERCRNQPTFGQTVCDKCGQAISVGGLN